MRIKHLLEIFGYLLILEGAFAIYCYDCVTATLDQCNKGIGLEYMECFEPINYDKRVFGSQVACLKANDIVNGTERIFRKCGVANGPEDSCNKLANISKTIECTTCLQDFCNSSDNLQIELTAIGVAVFLLILSYKYF